MAKIKKLKILVKATIEEDIAELESKVAFLKVIIGLRSVITKALGVKDASSTQEMMMFKHKSNSKEEAQAVSTQYQRALSNVLGAKFQTADGITFFDKDVKIKGTNVSFGITVEVAAATVWVIISNIGREDRRANVVPLNHTNRRAA